MPADSLGSLTGCLAGWLARNSFLELGARFKVGASRNVFIAQANDKHLARVATTKQPQGVRHDELAGKTSNNNKLRLDWQSPSD